MGWHRAGSIVAFGNRLREWGGTVRGSIVVMGSDDILLAVYGTLLGGGEGLEVLGPCRIRGVLYDLGGVPGLVEADGVVRGELLRVASEEVLGALDDYELYDPGRPQESVYVRRRVELVEPAGTEAWVYVYNRPVAGAPPVPGGRWRKL